METFTGPLCGEFTGEFPNQTPLTRSYNVFFDLRVKERLSKQSWGWWLETPSCPLWRHCNVYGLCVDSKFYTSKLQKSMIELIVINCQTKRGKYLRPFSFNCTVSESSYMSTGMYYRLSIYRSYIWYDRKCQDYVYIKWEHWSAM